MQVLAASAHLVFAHGRATNDTAASTAAPNYGRYTMKSAFLSDLDEQPTTQQRAQQRTIIKQKPEGHLKSLVANNMAAVGVTVCLLMVAMEMKTLYY